MRNVSLTGGVGGCAALALAGLATVAVGPRPALAAPVPILRYSFDQVVAATAGNVASLGSDATPVTMRDIAGTAADRRSAAGGGVSGLATDFAFANTESTVMGSAGGTSVGRADQADMAAVDGLRSFTVQGWYKADEAMGNSARIVSNIGDGNTKGFEVGSGANNRVRLSINTSIAGTAANLIDSNANATYAAVGQWVFFAVTYDGSATSNNVSFYVGTPTDAVSLVSTGTLNLGTVPDDTAGGLTIGNYTNATVAAANGRTFDGLLDDFRVYGSKTDGTGALTLADLEAARASDVPEPAGAAVAGVFAVAGLAARRRRRAR